MTTSTLAEAVCAVMAEVSRLKKADKNAFANYHFTSVDDFKDELRPLMAKHGLYVHMTQAVFELLKVDNGKGKEVTAARIDFDLTLWHVGGRNEPAECMTVVLPYTGAQTSGAARSYALKEWMKSRFLASSGDLQEEADMMDNSREGLRLSKADARGLHTDLQAELRDVEKTLDHERVAAWWRENQERLGALPKDWFLSLKIEYGKTWKALKAQADLDAMSEEDLDRIAQAQS